VGAEGGHYAVFYLAQIPSQDLKVNALVILEKGVLGVISSGASSAKHAHPYIHGHALHS
jgi:hypothetical protein